MIANWDSFGLVWIGILGGMLVGLVLALMGCQCAKRGFHPLRNVAAWFCRLPWPTNLVAVSRAGSDPRVRAPDAGFEVPASSVDSWRLPVDDGWGMVRFRLVADGSGTASLSRPLYLLCWTPRLGLAPDGDLRLNLLQSQNGSQYTYTPDGLSARTNYPGGKWKELVYDDARNVTNILLEIYR